jgi:hypothetical protein
MSSEGTQRVGNGSQCRSGRLSFGWHNAPLPGLCISATQDQLEKGEGNYLLCYGGLTVRSSEGISVNGEGHVVVCQLVSRHVNRHRMVEIRPRIVRVA